MIIRYPSFFYDASTSNMIVQCMASPVHEGVVAMFASGFWNARSSMSAHRRKEILIVTGEDFNEFHGPLIEGPKKIFFLPISLFNFGALSGDLEKSNLCWK